MLKLCFFLLMVCTCVLSHGAIADCRVNDRISGDKDILSYTEIIKADNIVLKNLNAHLKSIESILENNSLTYVEFIHMYPERVKEVSLHETHFIKNFRIRNNLFGCNNIFYLCIGGCLIIILAGLALDYIFSYL